MQSSGKNELHDNNFMDTKHSKSFVFNMDSYIRTYFTIAFPRGFLGTIKLPSKKKKKENKCSTSYP